MKIQRILGAFAPLLLCLLLAACPEAEKTPVDHLAEQAKAAADRAAEATAEPWEIEMITWRRGLMGRTGLSFYVVFINDAGQPIDYFATDGKCTSSNKRLIPDQKVSSEGGAWSDDVLISAPSEDGTSGSSDEYIYCFTVDGKYKQWNGDYYASDSPIELTIKPLVVSIVEGSAKPAAKKAR